jgi:hypothetical protein
MAQLGYLVTKDGVVFMVTILSEKSYFEMIILDESETFYEKIGIDPNLTFEKLELKEKPNGNIIASGFYTDKERVKVSMKTILSNTKNKLGVYYAEIGIDGGVVYQNTLPFTSQTLEVNNVNRLKSKSIKDLHLKQFNIEKDGSVLLIGEIDYLRSNGYETNMPTNTTTNTMNTTKQAKPTRIFGNLVVTKLNANGMLLWQKTILKKQGVVQSPATYLNDMGFHCSKSNDAYFMIFVDNEKNTLKSQTEKRSHYKAMSNGVLVAYEMNNDSATLKKYEILNARKINSVKCGNLQTYKIIKVDEAAFMMEVDLKNKQSAKVKFEL